MSCVVGCCDRDGKTHRDLRPSQYRTTPPIQNRWFRNCAEKTDIHSKSSTLAYSNLNEKRVEKAWIDLIFEGPEITRIMLREPDLFGPPARPVCRTPRMSNH